MELTYNSCIFNIPKILPYSSFSLILPITLILICTDNNPNYFDKDVYNIINNKEQVEARVNN